MHLMHGVKEVSLSVDLHRSKGKFLILNVTSRCSTHVLQVRYTRTDQHCRVEARMDSKVKRQQLSPD